MTRSLRVSRRPFIAFAIVLSPLVIIFALLLVKQGFRSDLIFPSLLPFILYAAILGSICARGVSVEETGISLTSFFIFRRFLSFSEILRSNVQILAERDHPVSVSVYTISDQESPVTIYLKAFMKEDVAWFCALPGLKGKVYAGLTKRT